MEKTSPARGGGEGRIRLRPRYFGPVYALCIENNNSVTNKEAWHTNSLPRGFALSFFFSKATQ